MGATAVSTSRKPRRAEVLAEINVTPLVDVVLVLLIIFMVIAPELEHGERVDLPAITTPDKEPKPNPVTVTITQSGRYFLEKEPMADLASLTDRLKTTHAAEPERRILLKGDSQVPYARFRETLAMFQSAGLPGVLLSVSQKAGAQAAKGP